MWRSTAGAKASPGKKKHVIYTRCPPDAQAPPDARKSLLRRLIREMMLYDDGIELRMYVCEPVEDTMPSTMPLNGGNGRQKRPAEFGGALTTHDECSSGRLATRLLAKRRWLLGRDSNPRRSG